MQVQDTSAREATQGNQGDILLGLMQDDMPGVGLHQESGEQEDTAGNGQQHQLSTKDDEQATDPVVDLGAAAIKATKAAVKTFASIQGFDKEADVQRRKVRELMAKQSACLEAKLHGQKAADGEDFESVAKLLRKENNRLDAMLEGKEGMFDKVRLAIHSAIAQLNLMSDQLKKMEEEG